MTDRKSGYLLVADITGFTQFLTGSEAEHADNIIRSLMDTLLEHTGPPLVVRGLEGDAVFSYGFDEDFMRGQTLVEIVEEQYVAFRRAVDIADRNTTCTCQACINIPNLDLKFAVHHGGFAVQEFHDGHKDLTGTAAIVVHRLLKNHVTEKTGCVAYAFFTDPALDAIGLDAFRDRLMPHTESYEHIGEVTGCVYDLHAFWEASRDEHRLKVPPDGVLFKFDLSLPVPVPLAWDYLVDPRYLRVAFHVDEVRTSGLSDGRMAAGTELHCVHARRQVDFTILDWQPFDYFTLEMTMPMLGTPGLITYNLSPAGDEVTQVAVEYGIPAAEGLFQRAARSLVLGMMTGQFERITRKGLDDLIALVEREVAEGKVGKLA